MNPPDLQSSRRVARRHILLVDDEPLQLKLNRARLIAAGFSVSVASCTAEALDAALVRRPDAIVSDVVMSELDGFALCSLFRCHSELGTIPIILLSAHVEPSDVQVALAMGARMLIQRSENFQIELDMLAKLLEDTSVSAPVVEPKPEPLVSLMANQMAQLLARSRSAQDRYQSLFDNASEAIAVLTPEGRILEVNNQWEHSLQQSRADVIGRHIRDFVPQVEDQFDSPQPGVASGPASATPAPIVRFDGSTVYMEFSCKDVSIAGSPVVLASGRDVTDGVVARQRLAASEEKYRTLLENIPDVVWSATLQGKFTFVGANIVRLSGFTVNEVMNEVPSFWFDRVHRDDVERVREAFGSITQTAFVADYRWRHREGHWIWIRSHATTRTLAEGQQVAEGTFADVTEQKRLEEQLRQAQKMEAVGQLTAGIAHDFNNILTVIMGNGELLRAAVPESDARRRSVDAMLDSAERAAGLTRQLLAFSRRQILEPRSLDLGHVLVGVEKMLRRFIGEDIDLSIARAAELHSVVADAGQIEQVLMNLVVNARDAMPRGGTLAIATENVTLQPGQHSSLPAGDYVRLTVRDSGCGMTEETRRRLFEPFFTTKEVGRGTGLGLSTCYGIVKQSNGAIDVESEPGRGSVFTVYLPSTPAPAQALRTTPAPASTGILTGTETILLVEDSAPLRALVQRILAGLGYRVLEARDGEEALAISAIHQHKIDLILSDVIIPGMSGPEIADRIRAAGGCPRTLFMSGYTDHPVLRDHSLHASVNFIQKPFVPAAIARKIREVLDANQTARMDDVLIGIKAS